MSQTKTGKKKSQRKIRAGEGDTNAGKSKGKYCAIIIYILEKIGHGKGENWIWERFLRRQEKTECIKCGNRMKQMKQM